MDVGVRLRRNSSVIITRETLWWNIGQFESGILLLEHDKLLPHSGGGKIIMKSYCVYIFPNNDTCSKTWQCIQSRKVYQNIMMFNQTSGECVSSWFRIPNSVQTNVQVRPRSLLDLLAERVQLKIRFSLAFICKNWKIDYNGLSEETIQTKSFNKKALNDEACKANF